MLVCLTVVSLKGCRNSFYSDNAVMKHVTAQHKKVIFQVKTDVRFIQLLGPIKTGAKILLRSYFYFDVDQRANLPVSSEISVERGYPDCEDTTRNISGV